MPDCASPGGILKCELLRRWCCVRDVGAQHQRILSKIEIITQANYQTSHHEVSPAGRIWKRCGQPGQRLALAAYLTLVGRACLPCHAVKKFAHGGRQRIELLQCADTIADGGHDGKEHQHVLAKRGERVSRSFSIGHIVLQRRDQGVESQDAAGQLQAADFLIGFAGTVEYCRYPVFGFVKPLVEPAPHHGDDRLGEHEC